MSAALRPDQAQVVTELRVGREFALPVPLPGERPDDVDHRDRRALMGGQEGCAERYVADVAAGQRELPRQEGEVDIVRDRRGRRESPRARVCARGAGSGSGNSMSKCMRRLNASSMLAARFDARMTTPSYRSMRCSR